MTETHNNHIQILQSARHVARAVEKARTKQLDMQMVAVEMAKWSLSILLGLSQEQCAEPVREMLRLYRQAHGERIQCL